MYTRPIKPPVIPLLIAPVAPLAPIQIWEGNGSVDMVCVCPTTALACVVLFGADDQMSTVSTTTGFPVGTEPIVFTVGPGTSWMSIAPIGAGGNFYYYFAGQTDVNA